MRRLELIEEKSEMKRSWYIQGIELEKIKELDIPMPESIKAIIELENFDDVDKFYRFSDNQSFDFISNQHWMINEIEIINLNLFEINKMLNYLLDERGRIIEGIKRIGTEDDLENTKVDLYLNEYKYKCFEYLKKEKEKRLTIKRK